MTHPHDDEPQHDDEALTGEVLTPAQAQEAEALGGYIKVEAIDGMSVRVRPQKQWRMSHLRALNEGDFDTWAAGVIHPDDVEDFMDADLTLAEFEDFAARTADKTGDGLGKSGRRSKSSKSKRKR